MSLAGFKKQINKANQFMSEKIGGAKGTELDDEFIAMERQVDTMGKLVEELMTKTQEMLQPNPASRAKMVAMKGVSKLRGQHNPTLYPQPEGTLGECMIKHGRDLGDDSILGQALVEAGESYKQLADIKYSLEDNVRQNFIEPLLHLQSKDLKEVNFHRKKLNGRRLDYDCKRRKQQKDATSVTNEEIEQAEEKFEESKQLAEVAMTNLLENEVEQLSQLSSFIEAEVTYHRQSLEVLQSLQASLQVRCNEASNRPKREHITKRVTSFRSSVSNHSDSGYDMSESQYKPASAPPTTSPRSVTSGSYSPGLGQPCAEALYDFDPENDAELGFSEGEMITLLSRIDDNWLEGSVRGKTGIFPTNYVKIIVDFH